VNSNVSRTTNTASCSERTSYSARTLARHARGVRDDACTALLGRATGCCPRNAVLRNTEACWSRNPRGLGPVPVGNSNATVPRRPHRLASFRSMALCVRQHCPGVFLRPELGASRQSLGGEGHPRDACLIQIAVPARGRIAGQVACLYVVVAGQPAAQVRPTFRCT